MTTPLTLPAFEEASRLVSAVAKSTPLLHSAFFSAQTGGDIWLKPENMQLTGAYKLRGAYYKIATLSDEDRARGLVTASAGNHAQGVAFAARSFGVPATIVMPTTTPLIKVNRTKALGAKVVLSGDVYDEACARALQIAEETGGTFVHPFDDPVVATGQGTIAVEILRDLPDTDVLLVPIGGGGLATGVAAYAKLVRPEIKVIGVEPAGAACLKASLAAGHPVTLPHVDTIADGTAVKTPGSVIFPFLRDNLDQVVTVPDEDLVLAFLDMVENHKIIVENSGLLSIAAARSLDLRGKKAVCVLSGGNMDVITMSSVVQQGLILRDRIVTVSVLLPDRPGELSRVSAVVAAAGGNVIKLEHNQFVSINRNSAVELRITMETFGTEHKKAIVDAMSKAGLSPRLVGPRV